MRIGSRAFNAFVVPATNRGYAADLCCQGVKISVIVCAHNEAAFISACACSLLAQTRPADEIVVINNASDDRTGDIARILPHIRVCDEPRQGLLIARECRVALSYLIA